MTWIPECRVGNFKSKIEVHKNPKPKMPYKIEEQVKEFLHLMTKTKPFNTKGAKPELEFKRVVIMEAISREII